MVVAAEQQPIRAYRSTSAIELHALALRLENAGVDSRIVGEALDGMYSGINIGCMGEKELWIAEKDLARAEGVITKWTNEHPSPKLGPSSRRSWVLHAAWIIALLFLLLIGLPSIN